MRFTPLSWRPHPMVLAIAATLCAAALVTYLQHRALSALRQQTNLILSQIGEQTAADVAVELRRMLDGPVFDTLTAVNHPELRAGRFDLVARQFAAGLDAYPHVDRFFAWHAQTSRGSSGAADEVQFFDRTGRSTRDPALSKAILGLAEQHAPAQQIYLAAEGVGPDARYQVFLRLFWVDARRTEYFAVLGFVIDPLLIADRLFRADAAFRAPLARRGDVPMQLRIRDERGEILYGSDEHGELLDGSDERGERWNGSPEEHPAATRLLFPMRFYPSDDIQSRLAAEVPPRLWTIEVAASEPSGPLAGPTHGYWLTAVSVLLMFVASALTVQAYRRSTELAQMQADFVAHVSHQLKTPLSLLSAATETLQMDRVRSSERLADYLRTIHAEATRLSLLVQRVLEFSRLQQRQGYEFEPVLLGRLAHETVDAFAHGLTDRRFRCETGGRDGPCVLADPAALEQVLANLLDNAVKYSPASEPVTVRVHATRTLGILDVSDHGDGIAAAERTRIFERFYRGSGGAQHGSFGLGLAIVREIVQAHRGSVEVVSAPGRGSTFRVLLPRHAHQPADAIGHRADQPVNVPVNQREVAS